MKALLTVSLLVVSNVFMTFAWYGHLRLKEYKWFDALPLAAVILFSWGIALLEYCFMIPANRIGFRGTGGPFSLLQLKVIQETIAMIVFLVMSTALFRNVRFAWNHAVGIIFLLLAVYFIFKNGD